MLQVAVYDVQKYSTASVSVSVSVSAATVRRGRGGKGGGVSEQNFFFYLVVFPIPLSSSSSFFVTPRLALPHPPLAPLLETIFFFPTSTERTRRQSTHTRATHTIHMGPRASPQYPSPSAHPALALILFLFFCCALRGVHRGIEREKERFLARNRF